MVHDKGKSTHPIEAGIAVPFDFGAVLEGYCSDFGRTVWIGEPTAEYLKTFALIMEAQAAGAAAMVSGKVTAAQVNATARKVIEDAGYGGGFRHRSWTWHRHGCARAAVLVARRPDGAFERDDVHG